MMIVLSANSAAVVSAFCKLNFTVPEQHFLCLKEECHCSSPEGISIGSYGVSLALSDSMDCRCALLEYFSTTEKLAFDKLQCDGGGNFSPLQCYQGGKLCYCADTNGAQLSSEFSFTNLTQFLRRYTKSTNLVMACSAMRDSVDSNKNHAILTNQDELYYDSKTFSFTILSDKPTQNELFL